eukprot:gene51688-63194_t
MTLNTDLNLPLFERAKRVIPGGVNSPVRAFRAVGGTPRFIARGEGAYIYDAEGKRYVDYIGSWGPMILGHGHPAVLEAVTKAATEGFSFGAPTEREIELAEEILKLVPSMDQVRLVSSGTEATMSAIRLARGALLFLDQGEAVGNGDLVIIGMDLAEGEEAMAVAAIFDERGLERGLHTGHLGKIDVAPQLLAGGSLIVEFFDPVAAHDHNPGLLRVGRIDKHLVGHGNLSARRRSQGSATVGAAKARSTVSRACCTLRSERLPLFLFAMRRNSASASLTCPRT